MLRLRSYALARLYFGNVRCTPENCTPEQFRGTLSPHNGGSKGCPTPTGWWARPRRAFTNLMPACEFGGQAMKETTNERPRCQGVADGCPPYTDRTQTQGQG